MRIGGTGAGHVVRRAGRRRGGVTGGNPGDDAGTRLVRRVRVGREFVRLDERRRSAAVTSVTIASDSTEALSSRAISETLGLYESHMPDVFRTPAITRAEASGYEECGFEIVSVLRLLTHDLERLRELPRSVVPTSRPRRSRIGECVDVDRRAFGVDHCFDRLDLLAALDATTRSRLRVVSARRETAARQDLAGFAITGRAGPRGYLQRVAVDPAHAGGGIGTALVVDALRWCRARGVTKVVVNTGTDNERALALYRRLGFVDTPLDLLLMERRG